MILSQSDRGAVESDRLADKTERLEAALRRRGVQPRFPIEETAGTAAFHALQPGDGSCFRAWSSLICAGVPTLVAQEALIESGLYPTPGSPGEARGTIRHVVERVLNAAALRETGA